MNKHIGDFFHHYQPQDNQCWKKQFYNIIQCDQQDLSCWRKKLPELPCAIDDIKCWKQQIPDLPCQTVDFQCWKDKLPPLPCKILDTICWQRYVKNWNDDGTRKTQEGMVPRAHKPPLNFMHQVDATRLTQA